MPVTIRQTGNEWLIEVQGESLAAACTEAQAQELAKQWAAKLKWVASWRFAPGMENAIIVGSGEA